MVGCIAMRVTHDQVVRPVTTGGAESPFAAASTGVTVNTSVSECLTHSSQLEACRGDHNEFNSRYFKVPDVGLGNVSCAIRLYGPA